METDAILAVDVGSSSVRAGLHDGSGHPIPGMRTTLPYELDVTRDGGATRMPRSSSAFSSGP